MYVISCYPNFQCYSLFLFISNPNIHLLIILYIHKKSCRPLLSVFSLIRDVSNPRQFSIEYDDGTDAHYGCSQRDNLVAVLLDICHAVGNVRVVVSSEPSAKFRLLPRNQLIHKLQPGLVGTKLSLQSGAVAALSASVSLLSSVVTSATSGALLESLHIGIHRLSGNSSETSQKASNSGHSNAASSDRQGNGNQLERCLLMHLRALLEQSMSSGKDTAFSTNSCDLQASPTKMMPEILDACTELIHNVPFPGISPTSEASLVQSLLTGLVYCINIQLLTLNEVMGASSIPQSTEHAHTSHSLAFTSSSIYRALALLLQTLYRIVSSKAGYQSFCTIKDTDTHLLLRNLLGVPDPFVAYWAVEVLKILCCCPCSPRNAKQEFVNKHTLLTESMLEAVMHLACPEDTVPEHVQTTVPGDLSSRSLSGQQTAGSLEEGGSPGPKMAASVPFEGSNGPRIPILNHAPPNPLLAIALSGLLESAISSRRDTTSPELLQLLLVWLGRRCGMLLHMLRVQSFVVLENAAILTFLLLRHRPSVSQVLKELALCEGLVLRYLYLSLFSPYSSQRYISRFLVSVWLSGTEMTASISAEIDIYNERSELDLDGAGRGGDAGKNMLVRILPRGLVNYLSVPKSSAWESQRMDEEEARFYSAGNHASSAAGYSTDGMAQEQRYLRRPTALGGAGDASSGMRYVAEGADLHQRMRKRLARLLREPAPISQQGTSDNQFLETPLKNGKTNPKGGDYPATPDTAPQYRTVNEATPPACLPDTGVGNENWQLLFYMATRDHRALDLIWNTQTRQELRVALELGKFH